MAVGPIHHGRDRKAPWVWHTWLIGKRCGLIVLTFGHRVQFLGLSAHRLHTARTLTQLSSHSGHALMLAGLAVVGGAANRRKEK
jgi:hypothetical protein